LSSPVISELTTRHDRASCVVCVCVCVCVTLELSRQRMDKRSHAQNDLEYTHAVYRLARWRLSTGRLTDKWTDLDIAASLTVLNV